MLYVEWFVGEMKKKFNILVTEDEVSYEAYNFYHEELDELLIPVEHLEKLPNPLLFETLMYVDDKRNEWIAGVVLEDETRRELRSLDKEWRVNCQRAVRLSHQRRK